MVCSISYVLHGNDFHFAIGYLLFLPIADAGRAPPCSYVGGKRRRLPTHDAGADDADVPSWALAVIRSLREKPPDALNSRTRNTPCLTSLNNELICQIVLEALSGMSCDATPDGLQVASFPSDCSSSLTVNSPLLSKVCINHFSASPTRLSVRPYAIQNTVTPINAVVIRVMSKLSKVGASVFSSTLYKTEVCRVRTAHQPLRARAG